MGKTMRKTDRIEVKRSMRVINEKRRRQEKKYKVDVDLEE